ncbi:MAG: hypothetical protein H0V44_17860 [Planctomycetes bacterium]|nr:hypothetical protein [Planctomycetota bacterium]
MRRVACVACVLALSLRAGAEDVAAKSYALVVAGDGGEAHFSANYRDWSRRLHALLTTRCGIPSAQVAVLMEQKDALPGIAVAVSTKENVVAAVEATLARLVPGDQLLVFLIGHGHEMGTTAKLCLPGPDLSNHDLAALLARAPTNEVVVVGGMCGSDGLLDPCSLPGRVLITATNSATEGNEAYFMEFFIAACETSATPPGGTNGVNLLDAFNAAATACPKWYLRQYLEDSKPPAWRIDGKQSRLLWQKFYGTIPEKLMKAPEDPEAEDAEPQLGEWGPHWMGRRMPTEHAQLDDNGDRTGSAIFVQNRFIPLAGASTEEDGSHALRTIIGQPRGDRQAPAAPLVREP